MPCVMVESASVVRTVVGGHDDDHKKHLGKMKTYGDWQCSFVCSFVHFIPSCIKR